MLVCILTHRLVQGLRVCLRKRHEDPPPHPLSKSSQDNVLCQKMRNVLKRIKNTDSFQFTSLTKFSF